ncbi:ABC transporter ATP-binding protein [Shinella sedimenti]|uniref:ABC transporter ATP-binding protein n=1 Tax=Shinella sedimenti TaxID=2919913 RepID=A0ABT0CR68_9HYPH|nr:ABC transporter ATP-binding protein [Shinella sedimenti]MCJ8151077.1 ABC transporter ATP-binding protein [Shinella sedimenti]
MTLESTALTFTYGAESVLTDIDLVIPDGRITALVGANGSGKSTILKNLARLLKPTRGSVLIDGKDIHTMGSKEVARRISILPQKPEAPDGLRVAELVAYGRFSWQSPLAQLNALDKDKISSALELTGMKKFAERELSTLSGGQRQRAWIAMALAQDSRTMLLDEPTTFLDLAHQFEVLTLLKHLNRENGKTIVMVLHDLNQAANFADNMIVVSNGRVLRHGPPSEVIVPEVIAEAFGVVVDFIEDPKSGNRLVVPVALTEQ